MPPKLSKKEQEEIARLEEEKRIQEEEERLRIEAEERKKYEPAVLQSGLECILTEYYIQEVLKSKVPEQFTQEFVLAYLKRQGTQDNFRQVDIQTLVDFHCYNIHFAVENLFNENEIYIFINILWQVLKNDDPKYVAFREKQEGEEQEAYEKARNIKNLSNRNKSQDKDLKLLMSLLISHSQDNQADCLKIFSAQGLQLIIAYARNSYFSHYNLYIFVGGNDQQVKEQEQTVYIDYPQPIQDGLDDANYTPLDEQKEDGDQQQQVIDENKDDEDEDQEQVQDEPLDPISQQILQEKLRDIKQQMDQQLAERKEQQEAKLVELQQTKGKKK